MIWGCFSSCGTDELLIIKETMNSAMYHEILETISDISQIHEKLDFSAK